MGQPRYPGDDEKQKDNVAHSSSTESSSVCEFENEFFSESASASGEEAESTYFVIENEKLHSIVLQKVRIYSVCDWLHCLHTTHNGWSIRMRRSTYCRLN